MVYQFDKVFFYFIIEKFNKNFSNSILKTHKMKFNIPPWGCYIIFLYKLTKSIEAIIFLHPQNIQMFTKIHPILNKCTERTLYFLKTRKENERNTTF